MEKLYLVKFSFFSGRMAHFKEDCAIPTPATGFDDAARTCMEGFGGLDGFELGAIVEIGYSKKTIDQEKANLRTVQQ